MKTNCVSCKNGKCAALGYPLCDKAFCKFFKTVDQVNEEKAKKNDRFKQLNLIPRDLNNGCYGTGTFNQTFAH